MKQFKNPSSPTPTYEHSHYTGAAGTTVAPIFSFQCVECRDTGGLMVFCPENGTDERPCDFCERDYCKHHDEEFPVGQLCPACESERDGYLTQERRK